MQSGAKKFIFFSSVKAAADTVPGQYLTEETAPSPGTPYGRSKLAAENYLLENDKQQTTNKSTYILRPCMIHGPGNKGNLNLLFKVVSNEKLKKALSIATLPVSAEEGMRETLQSFNNS